MINVPIYILMYGSRVDLGTTVATEILGCWDNQLAPQKRTVGAQILCAHILRNASHESLDAESSIHGHRLRSVLFFITPPNKKKNTDLLRDVSRGRRDAESYDYGHRRRSVFVWLPSQPVKKIPIF